MKFPHIERKTLIPLIGVITAFVISRIQYDLAGIRFEEDIDPGYWQFVDPQLLLLFIFLVRRALKPGSWSATS